MFHVKRLAMPVPGIEREIEAVCRLAGPTQVPRETFDGCFADGDQIQLEFASLLAAGRDVLSK